MISMLTALAALAATQLSQAGPTIRENLPADIAPRFVVGDMRTVQGVDIGVATLTERGRATDATIRIELRPGALKPGRYEVFVQDKAACAAPAKLARPKLAPQGAFQAQKTGTIYAQFSSDALKFDGAGVAIVIHGAGRRIACAEIRG